jgi:diguanylate cyclase (GGDEF)-like protein/PAS domain S-box-containing protein
MTHALAYERITALYAITADHQSVLDEKFSALLDLGRQTFELDFACVARIADDTYEVLAASPEKGLLLPGDCLPLLRTYCSRTIASPEPVGFDRASGSEWEEHPCFREFRLQAYLGARIMVDGRPWGTLSFSSRERVEHPHPEEDFLFIKLMAQWIGHELEQGIHDEKLAQLNESQRALEIQAALARANEISQSIVHAIGEGVAGVEEVTPHRIRFLNPAAQELLGVREGEVIGQPLTSIIRRFPDAPGQTECMLSRLVQGQTFECMISTPGRDMPFPAQFVSSHTLDDSGLIVLTVQDVTDRWEAEEQLRLAEQVFEYSPEAILVTDGDGTILRVNPAFTLITGYPPEDAIGQNPRILRSDRHDEAFYREMWRSLADEDHWHGEIWDRRKNGETYPKWLCINAVRLAQGNTRYVALFADISERKAHEERIDYLARHDALTGLANRRLLEDRFSKLVAAARRSDEGVALMLLDLDRFKQVNDSLGHQVGDQLLVEVARRLNVSVRAGDTVARLGGDEFVVLLAGIKSHLDIVPVAEKIRAALTQSVQTPMHLLHTSPSIGVSLFPANGVDLDSLLQAADIAMYQVKAAGRNAWMFFESRMNEEVRIRHRLETDLRLALERGEFLLHYQPQFNVGGDEVIAWEALLRWRHPQHGWIEPADFIPVAEDIGLIVPLGEWVLSAACREAVKWTGQRRGNERLAVNVSARQLEQGDLAVVVARILRESGLAPARLELELTESALMSNTVRVQQTLRDLKALGVHLTLDDFGTGYSSLAYLSTFTVDRLKIDRSFMLDIEKKPNNAAIILAVVALAKALGLEVVAEGVETSQQRAFLADSGCLKAQGFLYARPMPAGAVAAFMPVRQ